MGIAAAEGVARQLLGGGAVRFDQQRRQALRLRLVPESVDEILGRKLAGRRGLVAQQVANRVVVLAVGQPPQVRSRERPRRAGGLLFAIFERLRQLRAGELRELRDPGRERRFVGAAGFDPLSAAVRRCGWSVSSGAARRPGVA